jgi:4-amino-4-deoxy-L-arabinose transferase-like glycosyltransferase
MTDVPHLSRWSRQALALAIAILALLVCLRPAPPDGEQALASQAAAFVERSGDAAGRARPLLVHAGGERWLQPIPLYMTIAFMKVGARAETAARLTSAVAGALSAWLLYLLAARLFSTARAAALAAVFFVWSPAYLTLGSAGDPSLLVVPAVLAWLLAVAICLERPRPGVLALGAAALATGAYAQPAGVMTVPVFFALGLIILAWRRVECRLYAAAVLGLTMPLMGFGLWYWQHPETWVDTMGRWAIHLAHVRNPWHGVIAFTSWDVVGRRAGDYWHSFNPVYLFLSGPVFVAAAGLLWPFGLAGRAHARHAEVVWLLAASLLAAPVASVLLDEPRSPALAASLLPFGSLLAALGCESLLGRTSRVWRAAAAVLPGLALLQGAWYW